MRYHASGVPVMRTGSVVRVPADVQATERYGAGVSATPYSHTDANGMSYGVVKDVLRSERKGHKVRVQSRSGKVRIIRPEVEGAHAKALRLARERHIAGNIGNVE